MEKLRDLLDFETIFGMHDFRGAKKEDLWNRLKDPCCLKQTEEAAALAERFADVIASLYS